VHLPAAIGLTCVAEQAAATPLTPRQLHSGVVLLDSLAASLYEETTRFRVLFQVREGE
jgi:hypothetical protein